MGGLLHILCAAQLASAPGVSVALGTPGADGCAGLELRAPDLAPRLLPLPSEELCVLDALVTQLEGPERTHVVLTVRLRRDPTRRRRLFIYQLEEQRLTPRYLGSGPRHLELLKVGSTPRRGLDALLLDVRDQRGRRRSLRCAFEGFTLLCQEHAAAKEGTHG